MAAAKLVTSKHDMSEKFFFESCSRQPVQLQDRTARTIWDALLPELREWPNFSAEVTEEILNIVCNHARGGALMVQAPTEDLAGLLWEYTDDGYLQRRLAREDAGHVLRFGRRFTAVFAEFSEHAAGDRWPTDHADVDARGRPKDGGLAVSPTGAVRLAAVKFRVNLDVPFTWPGTGTRHATAFALAHALDRGIVVVRSDSGGLHVVTSSGARQGKVERLQRCQARPPRPPRTATAASQ